MNNSFKPNLCSRTYRYNSIFIVVDDVDSFLNKQALSEQKNNVSAPPYISNNTPLSSKSDSYEVVCTNQEDKYKINWIQELCSSKTNTASISQIKSMYLHLDKIIKNDNLNIIEYLFKILPSLDMSFELKTAILRYTFPIKHKLSSWNLALDNIHKELEGLGFNSSEILIGLR